LARERKCADGIVSPVDERVREWVREDFGLALHSMHEVTDGADDNARLWRAVAAGGARYAVKLSGGGTAAGLRVSAQLARCGVSGVPAPVVTRDGRLFSERAGRRLSVVHWVSDLRAANAQAADAQAADAQAADTDAADAPAAVGMSAAHWASFGALLAAVHAAAPREPLPREAHDHERVAATTRALDDRLRGWHPDGLVRDLIAGWRAAAEDVSRLLELTDHLGHALRTAPSPPAMVLCHGDPHVGNLLLGDAGRVWLVDWDDVIVAPRERDLIHVVGGVFAPVTPEQRAWFFDGYGPADLDPDRLTYHRCVRALEDFADFALHVLDVDRRPVAERATALAIVHGNLRGLPAITIG
jgi:spectinomycin phosphotransferase